VGRLAIVTTSNPTEIYFVRFERELGRFTGNVET
jgi:hypothetical protein